MSTQERWNFCSSIVPIWGNGDGVILVALDIFTGWGEQAKHREIEATIPLRGSIERTVSSILREVDKEGQYPSLATALRDRLDHYRAGQREENNR